MGKGLGGCGGLWGRQFSGELGWVQLAFAVGSGELVVVLGGGKAVEGWREIAGFLGGFGGANWRRMEA